MKLETSPYLDPGGLSSSPAPWIWYLHLRSFTNWLLTCCRRKVNVSRIVSPPSRIAGLAQGLWHDQLQAAQQLTVSPAWWHTQCCGMADTGQASLHIDWGQTSRQSTLFVLLFFSPSSTPLPPTPCRRRGSSTVRLTHCMVDSYLAIWRCRLIN